MTFSEMHHAILSASPQQLHNIATQAVLCLHTIGRADKGVIVQDPPSAALCHSTAASCLVRVENELMRDALK